jgi:iron complex transport system permease protein
MGGLESVGPKDLWAVVPFVLPALVILLLLSRELDLMTTGELRAEAAGVEVGRLRTLLFFTASMVTGAVVALCGPIGFVGLMVPHMCRLALGPSHRVLVPACFLAGAAFLGICDTLARSLLAPAELPVGILTSLFGGPFFLWLLLRRRGNV